MESNKFFFVAHMVVGFCCMQENPGDLRWQEIVEEPGDSRSLALSWSLGNVGPWGGKTGILGLEEMKEELDY